MGRRDLLRRCRGYTPTSAKTVHRTVFFRKLRLLPPFQVPSIYIRPKEKEPRCDSSSSGELISSDITKHRNRTVAPFQGCFFGQTGLVVCFGCALHTDGSPTVAKRQYPAHRSSLKTVHRTVFFTLRPSRIQVPSIYIRPKEKEPLLRLHLKQRRNKPQINPKRAKEKPWNHVAAPFQGCFFGQTGLATPLSRLHAHVGENSPPDCFLPQTAFAPSFSSPVNLYTTKRKKSRVATLHHQGN